MSLPRCPRLPRLAPASPEVAGLVARLDVLDYLAGDWEGSGWSNGPDGRAEYDQGEVIRRKLSGELMTIEGTGTAPDAPDLVVFAAFAVVTWNAEVGQYDWQATSHGRTMTTELVVTDNGWSWDAPAGPAAIMRYTTAFTDDRRTWHETGAYSADGGATWAPMMEMTLRKTYDASTAAG